MMKATLQNRNAFAFRLFILFSFSFTLHFVHAQEFGDSDYYLIDSLNLDKIHPYEREILESNLKSFHAEKEDSVRLNFIQNVVEELWDVTVWPRYNDWLLSYTENQISMMKSNPTLKQMYQKHYAKALNNKGFYEHQIGNYSTSIYYYDKSLQMHIILKDSVQTALVLNNLGGAYESIGNSQKNLDLNFKALELREALKDEIGMGQSCNNIGSIYDNLGKDSIALNYYHRSFHLRKNNGDIYGITSSAHNISSIYLEMELFDSCLYYSVLSIDYSSQINNQMGLAYAYNNLGLVYSKRNMLDSSIYFYEKSLEAHSLVNNRRGVSLALINTASGYYHKWLNNGRKPKDLLEKAVSFGEKGHAMSVESNSPSSVLLSSYTLAKIYVEKQEAKKTFDLLELHYKMRDSINNQDIKEAAFEKQTTYEFEKQKAINDLEHEKQLAIEQANQKRQEIIIYFVIGGLITLIVFLTIIFKRLKISRLQTIEIQKQKLEIELQHEQLEESHREIKDSITYANRLQRSLMSDKKMLDTQFKDYFVYLNPKEAVSGDFYWSCILSNGNFALVCADSTGHGVPGAIMSMMNMNSLKDAVKDGCLSSDEILNHTRSIIIETLANDGSAEGGKDGMDAALIIFNNEKSSLEFSLANNPLWIVRNSELLEFKPDKMPVGKHDKQTIPFAKQTFDLIKGDMLYLFTDGFADQFGGPKGKKFKYSTLKELLLSISEKNMHEQENILSKTFEDWRETLEQVDDVCVIGIRM